MELDVTQILLSFLKGSAKIIGMITAILTVLMVILEIVKDLHLLEKAARILEPVMKALTLPKEGAFPLLAGIFFGISYGSGVILQVSREGKLTGRDMVLISIFLGACHGMIEDPAIFAALGASWWLLVLVRAFSAVLIVSIVGRLWARRQGQESE